MQINRLFEMVYILLDKKTVTAKELSDHFRVSQRTIYRDIDILSTAGIPVCTNKGKGGGISLLDGFVLNKSMFSENEQFEILSSLQSLKAFNVQEVEPVINKLAAVFGKSNTSWIDVDFSRWGSNSDEKERFNIFKTAILNKKIVSFDYYSYIGEKTKRSVEPLKLVFKGYDWYVYAFCRLKEDYRMFKINRIKNLILEESSFIRSTAENIVNTVIDPKEIDVKTIKIVIKVYPKMAYRVFDEFWHGSIKENNDGSVLVTVDLPDGDWIYGYILSFGDDAEVIEPQYIRDYLKNKLEKCLKKYS
jgi:predicted DNA-binding transcriptional regulator YafY